MKRLALVFILFWLAGCDTPSATTVPTLRVTVVVQGQATLTPSAVPSMTPNQEYVCEGTPPIQLIVNQRGRVLEEDPDPLNVRRTPGTSDDDQILGRISVNEVFYVLDGPECADGYNWFYIRYRTFEGWIAEGDNISYFVEPFLTG
jgi:hypothetical protein